MRPSSRKFKLALGALLIITVIAVSWILFVPLARVPDHPFFNLAGPWVIAHRGGRGLGPENTLYAFRLAVELGVDVLEMDVRRTSDEVLVIFHDERVDGITDGNGAVQDLSLQQIKALDAGYHWSGDGGKTHPFRGQGIQVPTLEEVFQAFPDVRLNLEIKSPSPDFATALCRAIGEFDREESVLIASVHQEVMDTFRADCPEVATAATFKETFWFVVLNRLFLGTLYRPSAEAFQVPPRAGDVEVLTLRFVRTAKRLNLRVQVWTVDDPDDIEGLLAMGVDGIMTDYPDRLLELLNPKPVPPERR